MNVKLLGDYVQMRLDPDIPVGLDTSRDTSG